MTEQSTAETREFQAETRQLLELLIHSVYSNPDTFLRELISNSSDALDKLRVAALTESNLGVDTSDLHIELVADTEARTLTVRDNGIGMSRDEVTELIGTLARSGTRQMREALAVAAAAKDPDGEVSEQAAADLIGQFGIGFYSAFMVSDRVELVTRKAGESVGTRWESTGDGTYTIAEAPDAPQGTSVTCHLGPAGGESARPDYASEQVIRRVVRTYSDFIAWPIRMADADGEESTLNSQKALWTRPQSEVTAEEYAEFYRHIAHAWDEPLETITLRAEGTFEYQALLFLPTQAPFDLFSADHRRGVQLYVRRVFIMDDCEDLVPTYLRFVRGVVDAQDLPLNVSREILQQDRQIRAIRKRLVKKVLQTVAAIKTGRPEDFESFWTTFGAVLKEGLISDVEHRSQLFDVSVFHTTAGAEQVTIADYAGRMAEGQSEIYYLTAPSLQAAQASPHLEAFRARGVEVLLLTDPVDEVWVDAVGEVDGAPLRSVAKGDVDFSGLGTGSGGSDDSDDAAAGAAADKQDENYAALLDWLTETLSGEVKQVRLSHRLTESAACLVGDEFDMTPQLEAMFRASGQEVPATKRILEINPDHTAIGALRESHATDPDDPALADTARLIAGAAVLAEGGTLSDPAAFAALVVGRLGR